MDEQSVVHSTFVIERNYPHSPERVFKALADPAKKQRWFAAGDYHEVEEYVMDFRTGGDERFIYRFKEGTPFPGVALTNVFNYLDIVANRRIVTASIMTMGEKHISASLVTIELIRNGEGTDLICTHQGAFFEGSGGAQMREEGWRTLLNKLDHELAL